MNFTIMKASTFFSRTDKYKNCPQIIKVVPEGDIVKVYTSDRKVHIRNREAWENHIAFLDTTIYL